MDPIVYLHYPSYQVLHLEFPKDSQSPKDQPIHANRLLEVHSIFEALPIKNHLVPSV